MPIDTAIYTSEVRRLPSPCRFDMDHYEFILRRALDLGYKFYTHRHFSQHGPVSEPFILLRHDIDLSLEKALPIVRLEHSLGISSTIFIRVHAHDYNPFGLYSYAIIRQFQSWGCEMALHYDPLFMLLTREDPLGILKRDKKILETVLDEPIYGIASHAPRLSMLLKKINFKQLAAMGFCYDGNQSQFTQENFYLSDANGQWRRGCPCDHLGHQQRITLLIHPFWWHSLNSDQKYPLELVSMIISPFASLTILLFTSAFPMRGRSRIRTPCFLYFFKSSADSSVDPSDPTMISNNYFLDNHRHHSTCDYRLSYNIIEFKPVLPQAIQNDGHRTESHSYHGCTQRSH